MSQPTANFMSAAEKLRKVLMTRPPSIAGCETGRAKEIQLAGAGASV